jgi:hypothetical protein
MLLMPFDPHQPFNRTVDKSIKAAHEYALIVKY